MNPKYTHDCDKCKFLGQFNTSSKDFDLYVCINLANPRFTDLIARYSNVDSCYLSSSVGLLEINLNTHDAALTKAWQLAIDAGYALSPERLREMDNTQILQEEMIAAGRLVEAVQTLTTFGSMTSTKALSMAKRYLDSFARGHETYETEFIQNAIKYLDEAHKNASEYESKKK